MNSRVIQGIACILLSACEVGGGGESESSPAEEIDLALEEASISMGGRAVSATITETKTPMNVEGAQLDFNDYDESHADYYVMAHPNGRVHRQVSIGKQKTFPWLSPPEANLGSGAGLWYAAYTTFASPHSTCPGQARQVAHRYVSPEGSVWEMGGQPRTNCEDPTLNVFANVDDGLQPILIAPSASDARKAHLSEWWQQKRPYAGRPLGYPRHSYSARNYALSWADVVQHYSEFSFTVGEETRAFHDVVEVRWLHGARYSAGHVEEFGEYPCNEDTNPALDGYRRLLDQGFHVYGRRVWYARHLPEEGQTGGIIKDELVYYCHLSGGEYIPRGTLVGDESLHYRSYP